MGTSLTGDGAPPPWSAPSQVRPATVAVVLVTALALLGGLLVFWELRQIVLWTLAAIVLAVALSPAVERLRRRRVPRVLAVVLV